MHFAIWDRRFEAFEKFPTENLVLKHNVAPIDATNMESAREYIPSPRLVVGWLLEGLGERLSDFSLVDFGSGRGRVLLTAAEKPFRTVTGVEFSSVLHSEAQSNFANYPLDRIQCSELQSISGDAVQFELFDGDNVLYFYNPFGADILEKVVSRAVEASLKQKSRLLIIYYNPVHHGILDQQPALTLKTLSPLLRLKLLCFSPYKARIYELNVPKI